MMIAQLFRHLLFWMVLLATPVLAQGSLQDQINALQADTQAASRDFVEGRISIEEADARMTANIEKEAELRRQMAGLSGPEPAPGHVVVTIETDGELAGDVFSAMFIGQNGPVGPVVSAEPRIETDLPPGEYSVVLIRANDQRTIQLSVTVSQEPVAVTAKLPPLPSDALRMRLVEIAVTGQEDSDQGWFWQFVQGDRIVASQRTAAPEIASPLPVGDYVIRLQRGRDEDESRASLAVDTGSDPLNVEMDWAPRSFEDDAVSLARIIPGTDGQADGTDVPTYSQTDLTMRAEFDAQMSQIVVRVAGSSADLEGGTVWLTDGAGPGGLDVAFVDQRGEVRFSTLNIVEDNLTVEFRDASGLNIQAKTQVEGWR